MFSPVVISGSCKPFLPGAVEKVREAILGCVHAFEVHSPLEGRSSRGERPTKRPSPWRRPIRWGDMPQKKLPPPVRLRAFALSSLTPPQGGSGWLGFCKRENCHLPPCLALDAESRNRGFFNSPFPVGFTPPALAWPCSGPWDSPTRWRRSASCPRRWP